MKRLVGTFCVLLLAAPLFALPSAPAAAPQAAKLMSQRLLDMNAWRINTTNYGPFVNPALGGSGGFWGGPGYNYIYGAGLWFAGTTPSSSRYVTQGYDCASGNHEFGPVNPYTEEWSDWETDLLAREYLSTDSADVAEWPLRDSANAPIIISQQDAYCKYSDQNPGFIFWETDSLGDTINGPLNLVIEQTICAWNSFDMDDVVFLHFKVKNKNNFALNNCYIGPAFDADIGNEAGSSANDRTAFDYQRNLAMQFQATPEPGWPVTGVVGARFLDGPVNNTGSVVHVVDDQYPHDIQPDSMLGLTAFTIFTIAIDPHSDEERYLAMEGVDWLTMVLDAYDQFGAEQAGDKRFIMASGPFVLAAHDSVELMAAIMAAPDTASLKVLSDSVHAFYDAYLGVGGSPTVGFSESDIRAQGFPNPFHSSATIRYLLKKSGPISLKIYNSAGQLVRTLVKSGQTAGRHSVTWDGRDEHGRRVSAGVYLYQLQAGDRALTRKMVLVR